tara:strand:- start:1048 stop:1503 length:456 start_codon:yes stop_codon:yes gene_type:complete
MQKTTSKVRLSALTSAQTQITGVRPITKKTSKGINDQLNLHARARKLIDLFEVIKSIKPKQNEYDKCKKEFIVDLLRTEQDTFLVHGKKYYLKLVEEKIYTYSVECKVIQDQIDELQIDLEKLQKKEKLFGIAKHEDSNFSLRPIVNTEAI